MKPVRAVAAIAVLVVVAPVVHTRSMCARLELQTRISFLLVVYSVGWIWIMATEVATQRTDFY